MPRARGNNNIPSGQKGCSCKKSACLKNYCECYEAKIMCSNNCKCIGCGNIQCPSGHLPEVKKTTFDSALNLTANPVEVVNDNNYITSEIVDAFNECNKAQIDTWKLQSDCVDEERAHQIVTLEVDKGWIKLHEFLFKMKELD